jgi:sigma-B regulation protein RsbU (phosphoserine phosphatase)
VEFNIGQIQPGRGLTVATSSTFGHSNESSLRGLLREAANHLCQIVDGDFDFVVQVSRSDDDLDKLLLLVNFVMATARRSLNDLKDIHKRVDEDLAAARRLQEKLSPQMLPTSRHLCASAKCIPARAVGGDFFDFFRYERSGLYSGLLADVSGKGAPAALYAALASGIVGSMIENELNPQQMLAVLNRILFKRAPEDHFMTLTYFTWDDENLVLELSNAGLPEPLLCRNGEVQRLRAYGLPLGLFPEAEYDSLRIQCARGDTLLFYTDGVIETVDGTEKDFGTQRLSDVLLNANGYDSARIVQMVFDRVNEHCQCEMNADDQTVIAMKVL